MIGDFLNICRTLKLTMFTGSSQISFKVGTADIIFLFSQMRYYYPYFSLFSKCLKTTVTPKGGCETRTQDSGPLWHLCSMSCRSTGELIQTLSDGGVWKCVDSKGS